MTGRECGSCTLCCKVFGIEALNKPAGQWCQHCTPGKGCGIYLDRPAECAGFLCAWLTNEKMGPEWKPDKAKFFLHHKQNRLTVYVDPAFPDAWKRAPYYETLMNIVRGGIAHGAQVYVAVAGRTIVLLPDKAHDMGVVGKDEIILIYKAGDQFACQVRKRQPSDDAYFGGMPAS